MNDINYDVNLYFNGATPFWSRLFLYPRHIHENLKKNAINLCIMKEGVLWNHIHDNVFSFPLKWPRPSFPWVWLPGMKKYEKYFCKIMNLLIHLNIKEVCLSSRVHALKKENNTTTGIGGRKHDAVISSYVKLGVGPGGWSLNVEYLISRYQLIKKVQLSWQP